MSSLDPTMTTGPNERRFTGRHLLYWLLGFFGVMLVANIIFIWLALDTFTGVTNKNAYQDGLAYNERLAAAEAQKALGWQGQVTQGDRTLVLTLKDGKGAAVRGLQLEALLMRPTHDNADQRRVMVEQAPGRYLAPLELPAGGNWDLVISGTAADGTPFETRKRLWID